MKTIITTLHQSSAGNIILGSWHGKLCLCQWHDAQRRKAICQRICRHYDAEYINGISDVITQTIGQLDEFLSGNRKEFTIPFILSGTSFQSAVWTELMKIPFGTTISYAELAMRINKPKAVRAAASAIAMNPVSIIVPCHRVIGSDRSLTGYNGGLDTKQKLLSIESEACGSVFT